MHKHKIRHARQQVTPMAHVVDDLVVAKAVTKIRPNMSKLLYLRRTLTLKVRMLDSTRPRSRRLMVKRHHLVFLTMRRRTHPTKRTMERKRRHRNLKRTRRVTARTTRRNRSSIHSRRLLPRCRQLVGGEDEGWGRAGERKKGRRTLLHLANLVVWG